MKYRVGKKYRYCSVYFENYGAPPTYTYIGHYVHRSNLQNNKVELILKFYRIKLQPLKYEM